jgi:hypothetical protein
MNRLQRSNVSELFFRDIALGSVIDQNEMIPLAGNVNNRIRRAVGAIHFDDRLSRKHRFKFIGGTDH